MTTPADGARGATVDAGVRTTCSGARRAYSAILPAVWEAWNRPLAKTVYVNSKMAGPG
jgi:hypothetical protein